MFFVCFNYMNNLFSVYEVAENKSVAEKYLITLLKVRNFFVF